MNQSRVVGLLVTFAVFFCGCAARSTPVIRASGGVSAIERSSPRHSEAFTTALTPLQAAEEAAKAIDARFKLPVGADNPFDTGRMVRGDYFSASTGARAELGGIFHIGCKWIRDGETQVILYSDWPDAQHDIVAAEVRRALRAASTQPAEQSP